MASIDDTNKIITLDTSSQVTSPTLRLLEEEEVVVGFDVKADVASTTNMLSIINGINYPNFTNTSEWDLDSNVDLSVAAGVATFTFTAGSPVAEAKITTPILNYPSIPILGVAFRFKCTSLTGNTILLRIGYETSAGVAQSTTNAVTITSSSLFSGQTELYLDDGTLAESIEVGTWYTFAYRINYETDGWVLGDFNSDDNLFIKIVPSTTGTSAVIEIDATKGIFLADLSESYFSGYHNKLLYDAFEGDTILSGLKMDLVNNFDSDVFYSQIIDVPTTDYERRYYVFDLPEATGDLTYVPVVLRFMNQSGNATYSIKNISITYTGNIDRFIRSVTVTEISTADFTQLGPPNGQVCGIQSNDGYTVGDRVNLFNNGVLLIGGLLVTAVGYIEEFETDYITLYYDAESWVL